MKKNVFLVLLLTVLTVAGINFSSSKEANASIFDEDTPGDGFESGDPCGFLMGVSTAYHQINVDADSIQDSSQACADPSGYFYEHDYPILSVNSDRDSKVYISVNRAPSYTLTVDLVGTNYGTVVDQTTGKWSGYGYITDSTYAGSNRWVWFDWNCVTNDSFSGSDTACGGGINSQAYRVTTNLDTGDVTGYAWNDDLGFISFRNMTMELAPHDIEVYVDVLASDTELGPDDVDLSTAPLADGYDYWRIRVQFWDVTAGEFLDESDFETGTLNLSPTTIGEIFLNQIEDSGDPTLVSAYNPAVGCSDSAASYCSMTETDGSWSANTFIFSGAPTSNMTGINSDSDVALENSTDREGCRWIYHDQWYEVDHVTAQKKCPYPSGSIYTKADEFYSRTDSRNMLGLASLGLTFDFVSDRNMSVSTIDGRLETYQLAAYTVYYYYPDYNGDSDGDGIDDGVFLSYKPRFTTTKFVSVYGGSEYTQLAADPSVNQNLSTTAVIRTVSDAALAQGITAKPSLKISYQLDADTTGTYGVNDTYFLVDTAGGSVVPDCGRRTDTLTAGAYNGAYPVSGTIAYAMGYRQKSSACQGAAPTAAGTNTVSNPTVEQWVCDDVSEYKFNNPSCYYTGYLNIVDRHADPEGMKVLGAINSVLNDETIFTDTDELSVLGSTETIKLRNKMYAQVVRYMLGQSASSGTLDSSMNPSSGLLQLMNGRLIVAEGDVTITGSSAFSDKTLVVLGGNVYIKGDITNGRLGVIAFEVDGEGGNVYLSPNVVNLYANFFMDGALYSYNGTQSYSDEPSWTSDEVRISTLLNQLYINGSLSSRNVVNGSVDTDGDGYLQRGDGTLLVPSTMYTLDDGTSQSGYGIAREHDLNLLRQYRLCYPLLSTGLPDTSATPTECNEGERLSEYGEENNDYSPFVLEYSPADSLPIFRSQVGF